MPARFQGFRELRSPVTPGYRQPPLRGEGHSWRSHHTLPATLKALPPAGQTRQQALPEQVDRIIDRAAVAGAKVSDVVLASFLLAGMHQEDAFLRAIFQRGLTVLESSAFKVIEDLAQERYGRQIIRKLAVAKFGPPTDAQAAKLAAIDNLKRLDRLAVRVLSVTSWDALLKGR